MSKVSFIIVGAMKSGTTTLFDYLSQHPSVCFSSVKEPQYFSRAEKFSLGQEWYESLFTEAELDQSCAEASTCYSRWPTYDHVPERLFDYNPDLKLIYIVRQPAQRAYSHYRHSMLRREWHYESFRQAIETEREIIDASKYMMQVGRYLPYFSRRQMFFLRFEDVIFPQKEVFDRLLDFLSLESFDMLDAAGALKSNSAGQGDLRWATQSFLRAIRHRFPVSYVVDRVFSPDVRRRILQTLVSGVEKSQFGKMMEQRFVADIPDMTSDDFEYVMSRCIEDLEEFQAFCGLDLESWF